MWKVSGCIKVGETAAQTGQVAKLPVFYVEADSAPVAQERAFLVLTGFGPIAGPIDFDVSSGDERHIGQVLIRNPDPQVTQFQGGVWKVTGDRSMNTPG